MSIKLDKYTPLMMYLSPASIPQIVAHIQDYLVKHPILSVETIAEIIVQSLQEHPELINGEAIPISAESQQSIKAYIDALPFLDTYTKAEINALLLGKQDTLTFDQAPTPGSSNPVTSSGIIAAMSALQSALETQISAKADRASTYTKTQVDTLLEDKADADDVYSKNTMDAKLLKVNTDIDELGPYNGLDSSSTTAALSAAQGKVLNDKIPFYEKITISPSSAIASVNFFNIFKYGDIYNISLDFTVGNADIPVYTTIGSYNGTLPKHTVVLSNVMDDVTTKTIIKGSFNLSYRNNTIETNQALTANHRYVINATSV